MKFCKNCGFESKENFSICPNCGFKEQSTLDDKIKALKNKLLRDKEILFCKISEVKTTILSKNDNKNLSKTNIDENIVKSTEAPTAVPTAIVENSTKKEEAPTVVVENSTKKEEAPTVVVENSTKKEEKFNENFVKYANVVNRDSFSESFSEINIDKNALELTSFKYGVEIKNSILKNVAREKKHNILGNIILAILALAAIGALMLNMTFVSNNINGKDAILSIFKKTNAFTDMYNSLIANTNKFYKLFGYTKFAYLGFGIFAIIEFLLCLILIKKPKTLKALHILFSLIMIICIILIAVINGLALGFKTINIGLIVELSILVVSLVVIGCFFKKTKKVNTEVENDASI